MTTLQYQFETIVDHFQEQFLNAPLLHAPKWQSIKAPAPMVDLLNQSFTLYLHGEEELDRYREAIKPNLLWADRHFEEERVSGEPINPGDTWKIWPWNHSAGNHLRQGQYDHTYAERYWPTYAGTTEGGRIPSDPWAINPGPRGIRFEIGDLNDLVAVLVDDPLTRQAYLPIFYPEDLNAALDGKRVPCTLGYHFIRRGNNFHIVYPMRSCDFARHFRDDVYLTLRLMLWVLDQCRKLDWARWKLATPGTFTMHITSLHMFEPDREKLQKELAWSK